MAKLSGIISIKWAMMVLVGVLLTTDGKPASYSWSRSWKTSSSSRPQQSMALPAVQQSSWDSSNYYVQPSAETMTQYYAQPAETQQYNQVYAQPVETQQYPQVYAQPTVTQYTQEYAQPVVTQQYAQAHIQPAVTQYYTQEYSQPVVTQQYAQAHVQPAVTQYYTQEYAQPVVTQQYAQAHVQPAVTQQYTQQYAQPAVTQYTQQYTQPAVTQYVQQPAVVTQQYAQPSVTQYTQQYTQPQTAAVTSVIQQQPQTYSYDRQNQAFRVTDQNQGAVTTQTGVNANPSSVYCGECPPGTQRQQLAGSGYCGHCIATSSGTSQQCGYQNQNCIPYTPQQPQQCPPTICPPQPACPQVQCPPIRPCPPVVCPTQPACPQVQCPPIRPCPPVVCPTQPACPQIQCPPIRPCPPQVCPTYPVLPTRPTITLPTVPVPTCTPTITWPSLPSTTICPPAPCVQTNCQQYVQSGQTPQYQTTSAQIQVQPQQYPGRGVAVHVQRDEPSMENQSEPKEGESGAPSVVIDKVELDSTVVLTCKAEGEGSIKLYWSSSRGGGKFYPATSNPAVLVLHEDFEEEYQCMAKNKMGHGSASVKLDHKNEPKKVTTDDNNLSMWISQASSMGNVYLQCSSNSMNAKYKWFRGNGEKEIEEGGKSGDVVFADGILIVKDINNRKYKDLFLCKVENQDGKTSHATTTI